MVHGRSVACAAGWERDGGMEGRGREGGRELVKWSRDIVSGRIFQSLVNSGLVV